jgi:predicted PurR-regulated permease PerM
MLNLVSPERIATLAQSLVSTTASLTSTLAFLAALVLFMALDVANFSRRLRVAVRFRPAMSKARDEFGRSTRGYFAVAAIFVPNVGFLIGLIPPAVISLLTQDWRAAVIIVVGYSVINVVVQMLIQPKVVGDRVQQNTTLIFVALVLWTWILGGLGAIWPSR